MITKTDAKAEYALRDDELEAMPYMMKHNLVTMTVAGKLVSIIPSSRRVCDFDKLRDLDSKIYDQVVDDSESDRFTIK